MFNTFPSRRLALISAIIFLIVLPAVAQNSDSGNDYPTLAALASAVIPARDRVDLAERLLGVTDIPAAPTTAVTRQVGEQQIFTAANSSDNTTLNIPATLQVVGEHIYLWVENDANVNLSDLQQLAHDFDTSVYPNVRSLWGSEANPGIDGDPHIYGLFVHGLGASTAAYFTADHTYPKAVVPVSNEHEMFFFNLDAIGHNFPVRAVESIVSHEFQHMIRFNLQVNTETWLNEGLSMFTQYYLYGGLDGSVFSFLNQPSTQLDDWNANPGARAANYGAATLFLSYFYQRYGIDAIHQLSADHQTRALQAVNDVLTANNQPGVNDFFGDWVVANFVDDRSYANGKYGYGDMPLMQTPPVNATVTQFPYQVEGSANQYSADYYKLSDLNGVNNLDIRLDAPSTVALLPTVAPSGTHIWYSNRDDMADSRLTRSFDLTNVRQATLKYKVWFDTETAWDYGYAEVSTDGGKTWDVLRTSCGTTDDPHKVAYGTGYNGSSGGWNDETVSLNSYAGKQIQVRFEMITDDAVTRPGMAIDDLSIPEIGYTDDFENGDNGWVAEGWLLTDNRLPQNGWVQVIQKTGKTTTNVQRWMIDGLDHMVDVTPGVDQVIVAVSPYAAVTTVPMPYTLNISSN
ncbi:MAG: hypothetical protein GC204_10580 [Chloroflexi bacterium]|nr:hypothetical protein [Chloroflexota bacterium]